MFGLVENKINQAIKKQEQEISKLRNDKRCIVRKIYELEELVEYHEEIENSIKGGLCTLVIGGLIIFAINSFNIPLWLSGLSLVLSGMGLLGEIINIKNSKKLLSINGNKKKKKALLSEINGLEKELKCLLNKISTKENSLKEYNSMFSDIDILRKHQMSLGNDDKKIRKTCNYFYSKPQLAFDTVDEYNVYLKCTDENSKKEIIDYKVLSKQKR